MASALATGRAVAQRVTSAFPAPHQSWHGRRVGPQFSPEQRAFMQRTIPANPAGPAKAVPCAAAAPIGGMSAEQEAFAQGKGTEQASASNGAANPVPYSQRKPIPQPGLVGSLAKQPPASPAPQPSFRPTSRQPTASPAAAKWDHATRVMPAGAAPPVTPAGFDASLAQAPAAAAGWSVEQASASNGAANPVPYSQRKPIPQPGLVGSLAKQPPASPAPQPSFRPTSRQPTASPAAAKWDHATRVMPAGAAPPVTPALGSPVSRGD